MPRRLNTRRVLGLLAILFGIVAFAGILLDLRGVRFMTGGLAETFGVDVALAFVLWWAMAALLLALAMAYLAIVSSDLKTGLAWLCLLLAVVDVLHFLGGIALNPLVAVPAQGSPARWCMFTSLSFQYWPLAVLLSVALLTIVLARLKERSTGRDETGIPPTAEQTRGS